MDVTLDSLLSLGRKIVMRDYTTKEGFDDASRMIMFKPGIARQMQQYIC
jgi:hypothetical protein